MDKRLLKLIIISVLLYAGLNFGHPVTPAFLEQENISERYFGVLFSTMALALVLFSPFWGNKGDSYGRRVIIAIGIIGYGIGQLFFGLGGVIHIILLGRLISGIFAAAILTNHIAAFSEISNDNNRARNMTLVVALSGFAGALGYLIGGYLGVIYSPSQTLVIQGGYDIFLGILFLFIYPTTTIKSKERKSFIQNISHAKDIDAHIIYLLCAVTFFTLAGNNVSKFMDVYLNGNGFSTFEIGRFVMLVGLISGVVSIVVVPRLTKKFNHIKIMLFSLVSMILLIIATFMIHNMYISLYVTYISYYIFATIYISVEQTFISENTSSHFGSILGVREAFKALGLVSGPLIITLLFKDIDNGVFYFNAIMLCIALMLLIKFYVGRKSSESMEQKI